MAEETRNPCRATSAEGTELGAKAPLALPLASLIVGIVSDRCLEVGPHAWVVGSLLAVGIWLLASSRRAVTTGTLAICGLAISVGGIWHFAYWNLYPANHISQFSEPTPRPICGVGRVVHSPKIQPPGTAGMQSHLDQPLTRLAVDVVALRSDFAEGHTVENQDEGWVEVCGRLPLLVNGEVTHVRAGDRIEFFGKLRRFPDRKNRGGYSSLEQGRNRRETCRVSAAYPECLTVIVPRSVFDPRWWLEALHESCRASLFRYLDDDAAPLAAAVLLGDREYLEVGQVESFFVTGTVHLLAISGLHLAILVKAMFVGAAWLRLPRRTSLWLIMFLTLGYAALTGGRPPIIRAVVLVWMLCLELLFFRSRFSFNSLAAAGIIVIALNPTNVFNAGVQLSFLAVATLIWIARLSRVNELTGRRRERKFDLENATLLPYITGKLRQHATQVVVASCAIWFISIPLVMHRFHLMPASGLVLNLFLLLPLAVALYCGLLVMLFAWLPPMAAIAGWGCESALELITTVVSAAERFELAYGWVAGPTVVGLLAFYAVILLFGAFRKWNSSWPLWIGAAFTLLAISYLPGRQSDTSKSGVECAFLSVGHGVCIVLQLPDDQVWLYDAGSLGATRSAAREVSAFLWSQGISRLDGIVLSHADVDHFNVVPELVERFHVSEVCTSPAMFAGADPALSELLAHLQRNKVPLRFVSRGAQLVNSPLGQVTVQYPADSGFALEDNANSVVLDVNYFGKRILLTGDLEGEGIARLLETAPLDCDIMMAPHHGSRHSRPRDVAAWCRPEYVVVSGGDAARAREASEIYRQSGATVFHTARQGMVTAILTSDEIAVHSLASLSR